MIALIILFTIFYCFYPILSTPILIFLMSVDKKRIKIYLFLFVLSISLIILRYYPGYRDDSSFHYASAYYFSEYASIFEFLSAIYNGDAAIFRYDYSQFPLYGILIYLFSKTYTYSLISFVACFITYLTTLLPSVDLYKRNKTNIFYFLLCFLSLLLLNNYRYTTSGMRYCMVMGILIYLFYKDSQRMFKNDKFLSLYLIPLLIHPSSLLYIAMRLGYVFLKNTTWIKTITAISIYPFIFYILPNLTSIVSSKYTKMFVDKLSSYESNETYAEYFNLTLTTRIWIGFLVSIAFILVYKYLAKRLEITKNYVGFIILTYYISAINIGMILYTNIIDRNIFLLLPMIAIAIFMILITQKKIEKIIKLGFIAVNLGFIVLGIVYNKNFPINLLDYNIVEILTSSIFDYFSDLPVYYG